MSDNNIFVIVICIAYKHDDTIIVPFLPYTGIIDTPTASLFSYQPGESWATYYDPYFVPHYAPTFSDSSLEAEADALCGGDLFCLFDVAATGSMDIGLSTLEGGQEFERIMQFSIPGMC